VTEWKLVPVEPTEEMIAAIQDAAFAAWDAVVASEFNDDLPTYPPTYIQQQAWKAALDAAPEAPSAEPVAWFTPGAKGVPLVSHAPMSSRSYPVFASPPDHREVMRQAIEALRDAHAYSVTHEEFEGGVLDVIDALRAALGEKK